MSDAANLAFKIDLVLGGKASDSILDTYAAERQRPCIATIRGAVMNGRLIRSRNPLAVGGTRFVFYLSRHSRQITKLFWAAGTRKPRYRHGLVEPKAGASGRPIPMFKVQGKNGDPVLVDELIARHFALLSKASPAGGWVDRFEKELDGKVLTIGQDFHDSTGQVVAWLDTIKAEAALVRPDRHLFDAGNDADGLCRSLLRHLQQT